MFVIAWQVRDAPVLVTIPARVWDTRLPLPTTIGIQTENMQLYTHPLDDSGRFLIYRPLLGLAFVGNRAMSEICQSVAKDRMEEQTDRESEAIRFLESIGFLQDDPPPPIRTSILFQPTLAVLLMTNRCQLRCIYCYAAAGELPGLDLSKEIGRTAIDTVYNNAQEQGANFFEVSFHGGGEPSLAWMTLQACTQYARQKPLPCRITLTSNGIWSKQQRDWILANMDGVSLSMDGRAETQNRRRPFVSGSESFPTVWENLTEMDKRGFESAIRLTAAEPWNEFPKEIEFLCRETNCKKFHVEPTFHIQRGTHGDPLAGEGQSFVDAFLEALEIAGNAGRELVYSGARVGLITDTFCTAPYQALIVNPRGQLVSCYELAGQSHPMSEISVIGELQEKQFILDEETRNKLHGLLETRRNTCEGCF